MKPRYWKVNFVQNYAVIRVITRTKPSNSTLSAFLAVPTQANSFYHMWKCWLICISFLGYRVSANSETIFRFNSKRKQWQINNIHHGHERWGQQQTSWGKCEMININSNYQASKWLIPESSKNFSLKTSKW